MQKVRVLTKVLVGSRLHGLETEKSDFDYRGVHINDLKDVLSPFKKPKNTSWIEGDEDNTSYELADFCKLATQGNATILEVFFSDKVYESDFITDVMRENWRKFIDTDKFVMASRGYAHNQFNKMNLFEPDNRTPKFAVAYLRVMWQCEQFLLTGKFPCQITNPELHDYMMKVKHNWEDSDIPKLQEYFYQLQGKVTEAYAKAEKMKPDIAWIEDFVFWAYTQDTTLYGGTKYNAKSKLFDNEIDVITPNPTQTIRPF